MIITEGETPTEYDLEVTIMALSNLFGWSKKAEASAPATACGAGDKPTEKPAACGSACGAGDKPAEKPAACGSACGAGDKQENLRDTPQEKTWGVFPRGQRRLRFRKGVPSQQGG